MASSEDSSAPSAVRSADPALTGPSPTTPQELDAPDTTQPTRPMGEGPILLSLPSHLHVEDVYLNGGRPQKGAFEVRNDGPDCLAVELTSRGAGDIDYWNELTPDRKEPSKSSNVSLPSTRHSSAHSHRPNSPLPPTSRPLKHITLDPFSSQTVHFTFAPPPTQSCSPAITEDPAALVTPKAMPVNSDLLLATPVPGGALRGAMQKAPTWWLDGEDPATIAGARVEPPVESFVVLAKEPPVESNNVNASPSQAVPPGLPPGEHGVRGDAVKSAYSVHGDLVFVAARISPEVAQGKAAAGTEEAEFAEEIVRAEEGNPSQTFIVPYAASICESVFFASAAPASCSTPLEPSIPFQGSLSHSSQLSLNFGTGLAPRTAVVREFVVSNASEIPLALSSAVVFDSSPWQLWAVLEDVGSGEKFPLGGEGTDGRKVTLLPTIAPLQTRRFAVEVYVGEGGGDDTFFLDVLLCNLNNSSNTLLVQASGSSAIDRSADQDVLQVLSGPKVNFGSIIRGSTTRLQIRVKNTGDEPIDVRLGKEVGWDVKFLYGGVKGDELLTDEVGSGLGIDQGGVTSHLAGGVAGPSSVIDSDGTGQQHNFLGRAGPSTFIGGSESSVLLHPRPVSVADRAFAGGAKQSSLPFRPSSNLSSATESNSGTDGGASSSFPESSVDQPLVRVSSRRSDDQPAYFSSEVSTSSLEPTSSSLSQGPPVSPTRLNRSSLLSPSVVPRKNEPEWRRPWPLEPVSSSVNANQIDDLPMKPGTEYLVWLSYTPSQEVPLFVDPGSLVATSFRLTFDYSISSKATVAANRTTKSPHRQRKILPCEASVCSTSLKVVPAVLNFGQVTVGSSKSSSISVSNLSDLPAKIELRFISKVLHAQRHFFTIPPRQTTVERIDFFPRRINPQYTKQLNVRSLLDRSKDQMVEIHAENVDLDGVTLHSHLYKIYTPSGLNAVDFGSVIVNSPAIRTITIKNVQPTDLLLSFAAADPDDLAIYAKATELPPKAGPSSEAGSSEPVPESEQPPKAAPVSKRERFLESMAIRGDPEPRSAIVARTARQRDKSAVRGTAAGDGETHPKPINMVSALKKGSKGRSVALYGNVVILKDRTLLSDSEYLDLAGPPLATHRTPSPSQRIHLLNTIENEDKTKLSGKFPKIAKTVFGGESKASKAKAAAASASPADSSDAPTSAKQSKPPSTPKKKVRSTTHEPGSQDTVVASGSTGTITGIVDSSAEAVRSPALTGKRKQRAEPVDAADVSRLSLDELLSAIEHRNLVQSLKGDSSESEELYVRTTVNLKKALQSAIDTGKLVPVTSLSVGGDADRQLVLVLKPNGATRPDVQADRSKRQDSKILIRLLDFDRSLGASFPGLDVDDEMLPVRELPVRSNMTRSVLDVAQTHINFGNLEKGDSKSKTIIIHNRSETPGLFRIRLSGKISSNDFKLGEGRYGVVGPFGKKEVAGFVFTPSMPGLFSESLIVENVQDGDNDMVVSVKATVRKTYSFWVSPLDLVVPDVDFSLPLDAHNSLFSITNSSKGDRSFIVEVDPPQPELAYPCALSVQLSDGEAKASLTKAEDEELENILQKLKIARRKAKPDKIEKYEARLVELGVPIPAASTETEPSATPPLGGPEPSASTTESTTATPRSTSPPQKASPTTTTPPASKVVSPSSSTRIAVQLAAGQAQTVKAGLSALFGPSGPPTTDQESESSADLPDLRFALRIWEKKNSDDVRVVNVVVSRKKVDQPPATSDPTATAASAPPPTLVI